MLRFADGRPGDMMRKHQPHLEVRFYDSRVDLTWRYKAIGDFFNPSCIGMIIVSHLGHVAPPRVEARINHCRPEKLVSISLDGLLSASSSSCYREKSSYAATTDDEAQPFLREPFTEGDKDDRKEVQLVP